MAKQELIHGQGCHWGWREPDHRREWRSCSYCGSVHPDDLLAIRDDGRLQRLDWADWKYGWPHKAYAQVQRLDVKSIHVISATTRIDQDGINWVRPKDFTKEQATAFQNSGFGGDYEGYRFGVRTTDQVKLYSVHLADPAIGDATRETLFQALGLVLTWTHEYTKVSWHPYGEVAST